MPIALSDKDINEVFNEAGAPTTRDIQISRPEGALKASAEINNLDSLECVKIIDYFQGKVIHGNKVFCRGSSDLHTPKKNEKEDANKDSEIESNASNLIPEVSTPTESNIKETPNKSITKEQIKTTLNIEGQSPVKPPIQPIPGLPSEALALTKNQIKKLKKNSKLKSAKNSQQLESLDQTTQKALADYKISEFVFDDSEDETKHNDNKPRNPSISVNDIVDKLEKRRREAGAPQKLRKGRPGIKVLDCSYCEKKMASESNTYITVRIEYLIIYRIEHFIISRIEHLNYYQNRTILLSFI